MIDLFPCEVQLPDGTFHRRARLVSTDRATVVWVEDETRVPVVVFNQLTHAHVETPNPMLIARRQRAVIATDAGNVVANRLGTCACGPLLRVDVSVAHG